eukprot:jgi/Ulvmu1/8799/UM048_0054.1
MASLQVSSVPPACRSQARHTMRCLPARRRPSVQCRAATTDTAAPLDVKELANLAGATVTEVVGLSAVLFAFDKVVAAQVIPAALDVKYIVFFVMLTLSLKSGVLSVLDTRRPDRAGGKGFDDRKKPAWCPPGVVFPIVWSLIALLRAGSATLVFQELGALCTLPIIIFVTHLAIGDTWNYVTNAQQRLGQSATGVSAFVFTSAVATVATYYTVTPNAGLLLLPLPLWLLVAQVLVWSIWDLNGRQPLLPRQATD